MDINEMVIIIIFNIIAIDGFSLVFGLFMEQIFSRGKYPRAIVFHVHRVIENIVATETVWYLSLSLSVFLHRNVDNYKRVFDKIAIESNS